jgi:serine protease Do
MIRSAPATIVSRLSRIAFALIVLSAPAASRAQTPSSRAAASALDGFSAAIEAMAQKVSPAVVQVVVSSGSARDHSTRASTATDTQQSIGSGVIVAPDGYIMTNAHVVEHARQVRVRLVPSGPQTVGGVLAQSFAALADATVVGTFPEGDLALLKIQAEGLPVLPIADLATLRQGQIVFAFGSPQGLQNSLTMGVVSSIARQLDPDSPMLYIQTDTPINPGNSGGPLVNAAGAMVGLNTFIATQSGGNEGIGFAVPGLLVRFVFEQIRKYGHVHRPVIGVGLQTITPTLAAALKLPRDSGVLVSDVMPGTPAAAAGMKLNDLLLTADNRPLDNVAAMTGLALSHVPGAPIKVQVLRSSQVIDLQVVPVEAQDEVDRLPELADPATSEIAPLGLLAITVDDRTTAALGPLRLDSGAVVVGRTASARGLDLGLQTGDVIHEINGTDVFTVENLRTAVAKFTSGNPVAVLVERGGRWFYVAFEMP